MDRCGVGLSSYKSGRTLRSTAEDAHQLARHLNLQNIILVGSSGEKFLALRGRLSVGD
jgi:pimeloyl-ACP methyl ester carboxylesterase